MRNDSKFVDHVLDLLKPIGGVRPRAMFGGWGLYHGSTMFGLIAYDQLYFKVDDQTRDAFREAGSRPFVYSGKGKPYEMSYWLAPEGSLDDGEKLDPWARLGLEAARRAKGTRGTVKGSRNSRRTRRTPLARKRKAP